MNRLLKNISFTKSETKVILFIIFVLVAGFSIKYYKQIIAGNSSAPYDFTRSDSIFKSRSGRANENKFPSGQIDSSYQEDSLYRVLSLSEDSSVQRNNFSKPGTGELININTAGKDELVELPGVGESIAQKILDYRDKTKGFKHIEDLMNVSGIGKKKFEKIKNYIKTN